MVEFMNSLYFAIIVSVIVVGFVVYRVSMKYIQSHTNQTYLYNTILNDYTNTDYYDLLTNFIDKELREYMLLYSNNYMVDGYIKEGQEISLNEDFASYISSIVSEELLNKLSLYYRASELPLIISKKCYLTVTLYVSDNNKAK